MDVKEPHLSNFGDLDVQGARPAQHPDRLHNPKISSTRFLPAFTDAYLVCRVVHSVNEPCALLYTLASGSVVD
jgi:hypothetical protein